MLETVKKKKKATTASSSVQSTRPTSETPCASVNNPGQTAPPVKVKKKPVEPPVSLPVKQPRAEKKADTVAVPGML